MFLGIDDTGVIKGINMSEYQVGAREDESNLIYLFVERAFKSFT